MKVSGLPLTRSLRRTAWIAALSTFSTAYTGWILRIADQIYPHHEPADPAPRTVLISFTGRFADGGDISADVAVPTLQHWCRRPEVMRLVLRLSSHGGAGVEAERIGAVLDEACGAQEVIALIEYDCLSACYQLAMHADRILASRYATVGAIGAVRTWTEVVQADAHRGHRRRELASGTEKIGVLGANLLTPAQTENLSSAVRDEGAEFVRQVHHYRGDRLAPDAPIAQGGLFAAVRAKEMGLIDDFATIEQLRVNWPGHWEVLAWKDVGVPTCHEYSWRLWAGACRSG